MSRRLVSAVFLVYAGLAGCSSGVTSNKSDEAAVVVDSTSAPDVGEPPVASPPGTPATTVAAPVVAEPPRVLLVGDSTLLAVERYDAVRGLRGFVGDLDSKSCRTLGIPSCGDPPIPPNAVETIRDAEGPYDIIVVMAGYDEWWTSFPDSMRAVAEQARAQGAHALLVLNYREGVGYVAPDGRTATEAFERNNATLRELAASGEIAELVVADWFAYTSGPEQADWLTDDGIHLTRLGAWGVTDYISRWIAHLAGRPCPADDELSGAVCPNPDELGTIPADDELVPED